MTELVDLATETWRLTGATAVSLTLSDAIDARTKALVADFLDRVGAPPAEFAWMSLGSVARREVHCASDQDSALVWTDDAAATSPYARELAEHVISGLSEFGLRRCSGGFMADKWSLGLDSWCRLLHRCVTEPTPQAVLETDVFLDLRHIAGNLDTSAANATLLSGSESPRLLHGLAAAAISFRIPLGLWGRLRGNEVDLKRTGLAPLVLLARLYGLWVRSEHVSTIGRLADAAEAGVLGSGLVGSLIQAQDLLTRLRIEHQLEQAARGEPLTDTISLADLDSDTTAELRDALKSVKSAQDTTSWLFRTDL